MFYSIDLDGLRVMHKTSRFDVCAALVHLEASDCNVLITSFSTPGALKGFTVFELHKLYTSITGAKFNGWDEGKLRAQLDALMDSLPVTDCRDNEVMRQADAVTTHDDQRYRYVKGAIKPALRDTPIPSLRVMFPNGTFQYTSDPALVCESPKHVERATPIRSGGTASPVERPTEGIGLEIWTALDENPTLCDGLAIQAEAKRRGWNTLTAIMQLAQWKKFNGR